MSGVRSHNNFDALRMIAATVVVLSHSVQITYGSEQREIVWLMSNHQTNAGALAVNVFFSMSGYLITASFVHSKRPRDFVVARLLRLLPALAVVLLLLALALGPVMSSLPLRSYVGQSDVYAFIARNVVYPYGGTLPGVFQDNPMRGVIDGSLWTLRPELACYLLVFCLGLCGGLTGRSLLTLYICGIGAVAFFTSDIRATLLNDFLGGAAIFALRVPLLRSLALLCAGGWMASLLTGWEPIGTSIFAPYLVIYVALAPAIRLPRLARFGDLSYGTYIYAYPIQQVIVAILGTAAAWYWTFLGSIPIVLLCAFLSWRLVEAPALRLKNRFRKSVSREPIFASNGTAIGPSTG